jgi:hypothetical protein
MECICAHCRRTGIGVPTGVVDADEPVGTHLNWETVDPEKWVPDGYAVVRVDGSFYRGRGGCRCGGVL